MSTLASYARTNCQDTGSSDRVIESVVTDPRALRRIRRLGLFGLGETYMDGSWNVEALDDFLYRIFTSPPAGRSLAVRTRLLLAALTSRLIDRQAGGGAFRIGVEHYDLGNDLFSVMLDRSMTYTCGYWAEASDLDAAQEAKLDILCRKLELQPGMRVLDIGCGWGNFAHHAATHYGVQVTGITVSKEQAALAAERCDGLAVDIRLQDYRSLAETFDRVVSIEMIEAVGRRNLGRFYSIVDACLEPQGLFALQAITGNTLTRTSDRRLDQYILWLAKYIFPDGCLPRTKELTDLGGTSLRVQDWQSFPHDYNRTLLAWADRFNAAWPELATRYGERFKRRWHFYLYGCAAAFRAGLVDVCQIVYSKDRDSTRYSPVR
jgi:cyclopropane-fatty-acyl-phospholipid synthase